MRELVKGLRKLPGEALHVRARRARAALARSEYELCACLLALERSGRYRERSCSSIVQYAVLHLDLDGQKAGELLRSARAMEHLPRISEAFLQARLGWGKLRELTKVATTETEEGWLEYALAHSTEDLQRQVSLSPREHRLLVQSAVTRGVQATLPLGVSAKPDPQSTAAPQATPTSAQAIPTAQAAPSEQTAPTARDTPKAQAVPSARGAPSEQAEPPASPARSFALPGPKLIRVVHLFTAEEYAVYERGLIWARNRLRKRVRREAAVVELARQALAETSTRAQVRTTAVIHVDAASGQAWYETERGVLSASAEQRDEALATGQVYLQGNLDLPDKNRKRGEQNPLGKVGPRIPLATLRALFTRAQGRCEAPGCSNTTLLQAHHRQARSRGGTHALEDLTLLCCGCHGVEHTADFASDPAWRNARDAARPKRRARAAPG